MGLELQGKTALITGANRGIGKAILEKLLSEGVERVYAAVRDPDSVAKLVKESGGRVVAIQLDLSDPESIVRAAKEASDVQVVINNAGVLRASDLLSESAFDALDFEIDVNVKGLMRVAQAFAPRLVANAPSALVQLNSVASLRSFTEFATYCASKAASYSITQALRDLLGPQGVQVVSVHPGPIATDMGREAGLEDVAEPASVVADALVQGLANDQFHVFPDSMARQMWEQYEGFARQVVESEMSEA